MILNYSNFKINDPAKVLIKISKLAFERNLTDTCGGNLSLRYKGKIYITPRYSGECRSWAETAGR